MSPPKNSSGAASVRCVFNIIYGLRKYVIIYKSDITDEKVIYRRIWTFFNQSSRLVG